MDKEDVVYGNTTLNHKEQNLVICNNMDGLGDYCVK